MDLSAIVQLAEEFSPRVELGASSVALDASGVSRLFGGADGLARELARQAAARHLAVRVAVAATRTAATLAATKMGTDPILKMGSVPIFVMPPGAEREALAPLPLEALAAIGHLIGPALARPRPRRNGQGHHYRLAPAPPRTDGPAHDITRATERLRRWGLRTLGDLAALPAAELSARLGAAGPVLQRAARGEDERPLVPETPDPSFRQAFALDWPVDDLQPLAFIVARLCEALEHALARADRGAIAVMTHLRLVTKDVHVRRLTLPAPMRDARVLRTLVMLDLESHPPGAAVDELAIDVEVAPGRVLQTQLFAPALPAPETLSTLVARLGALVGESRVGAPTLDDTHRPGAFGMGRFAPHAARPQATGHGPQTREINRASVVERDSGLRPEVWSLGPSVVRRFRPPRPARVTVREARPVRVTAAEISGAIEMAAGPWRSSGGWWHGGPSGAASPWDRDEWDVALDTGLVCRLAFERPAERWVVDGVLD